MKIKRFLAGLLALSMVFGTGNLTNVSAAETTDSSELLAEGLTEGTYTDTTADADTEYEYVVVGSDGSTDTVSTDLMENLEIVYEKLTWTTGSFGTSVLNEDGESYLIVGAHTGSYHEKDAFKAEAGLPHYSVAGYLDADGSTIRATDDTVSGNLAACEWAITAADTEGEYYISPASDPTKYLQILSASKEAAADDFAVTLTNTQSVSYITVSVNGYTSSDSLYTNSVYIGGVDSSSATGYLNARTDGYAGTWTGADNGSCLYLYEKMYTATEAAIAEVTAEVGSASDYTEDSVTAYNTALAAAQGSYETADEANEALANLETAVAGLEPMPWAGIVEAYYQKAMPTTSDNTDTTVQEVPSGDYLIVGTNSYANKAITTNEDLTYTDVTAADDKITPLNEALEWKFTWTGSGYTVESVDDAGYYLNFTDENTDTGVKMQEVDTPQSIQLDYLHGTGGTTYQYSLHVGTLLTEHTYLNNRGNGIGSYNGWYSNSDHDFPDNGSSFFLYKETYTISDAKMEEATTGVGDESTYTTDSWTAYDNALTAAEGSFDSAEAAYNAYVALTEAKAGLIATEYSYTMKELYDAICTANGGKFLFSEEVYDSESGKAYREALEAARGTFTTEDEKEAALADLVAAVEALELNTGMKSVFPEMTWLATTETESADTTTGTNYIQDLLYTNTSTLDPNSDDTDGVTFDANEALTWTWSEIERLVIDGDDKTNDVWTTNELGLSHRVFSHSVLDNNAYEKADVYKISGSFEWPEGYDLANTTVVLDSVNDFYYRDIYEYIDGQDLGDYFPLGQVLPVDDDVYVVLWAEQDGETKPTVDDINNHLAFWAGTSGKGVWSQNGNITNDWGRTETATFLEWNLQGERTFRYSYPNIIGTTAIEDTTEAKETANAGVKPWNFEYLQHTDGWYTLTDTSAVNSVLRDNYPNGITAGTIVHVDLYVMNNSKSGSIDEFEIELYTTEDPDVEVNYYLNGVSEDTLLGTEYMLNVPVGTEVTLMPGVRAGQLNSYKAEAIYKAGYKDVTDGVQVNELTVTESGDNVVNVIYTVKDAKIVYLTAESGNYIWDGTEYTLKNVTITEDGVTGEVTLENEEDGIYKLPDGNYIYGVFASVSAADPGYYDNLFINKDQIVVKSRVKSEDPTTGNIITTETVLTNYVIITTPGKLTITYEPEAVTKNYDFGVENVYTDVLEDVELKADFGEVEDHVAISNTSKDISYTPVAANTGEIVELELGFAGGYTVTKELTFLPATNVLYEDNFVTEKPNKVTDEETGEERDETAAEIEADAAWTVATANARTVADNEGTVYGYSAAYDNDFAHSNDTAMMAELVLNGNYVETERAATFSFTGTGFDLISACGTNTGMLLVQVTNATEAGKAKFYLVDTYFTGDETLITGDGILDYQVPVIREMDLPYGEHEVNVWGYLVNTTGAGAATYGMSRMSVTTDDIIMAALDCAGVLEEVDVADVEVSFIDENSSLNGGTGNVTGSGVSTFALTDETETTAETTATTAYVYIDGFRVYGALEDETSYVENEQGLKYVSVYDYAQNSAGDMADEESGLVSDSLLYVEYDGEIDVASIAQYKNQGPQNEVYLTSTDEVISAIGFVLENYTEGMTVMVSAKAVSDGAILGVMNKEFEFEALGDSLSATEMYYDISNYIVGYETGKYMVAFNNSGTGVLSVSELKLDKNINAAAAAEAGAVVEKALEDSNTEYAFVPARFEVSYNDTVQSGRTTSISVKTSLPVDGEPENTVARVELLDENGELVKEFKLSNKAAVNRGKASYCSYSASVKITGDVTYQAVAYNENGDASAPLEITINVQ